MSKNVCYTTIDNLFVAVWGRSNLADEEVPEVLKVFRRLDFDRVRMLVVTAGGGPNPVLRKEMNAILNGREMPTAIVTDDIVTRGVVTALSWFNTKIRWFPMSSLSEALEYLDIPDSRFDLVDREVRQLRTELDRQKSKSVAVGR